MTFFDLWNKRVNSQNTVNKNLKPNHEKKPGTHRSAFMLFVLL